jgi:hypothetical protein
MCAPLGGKAVTVKVTGVAGGASITKPLATREDLFRRSPFGLSQVVAGCEEEFPGATIKHLVKLADVARTNY